MAFGGYDLMAIDPSHASLSADIFVAKQLYTGLTQAQPDGTVKNMLATGLTPDATCLNWQIKMRTGTTFSDGSPVTPDSFILGWTRAVRAYKATYNSSYLFSNIKGYDDIVAGRATTLSGVQKDGADGLKVALAQPDCDFGKRLSNPVYAPLPTGAGTDPETPAYNDRPIGNGPFKVQTYAAKSSLVLVRNDSWAFGKARLDQVDIALNATDGQAQIQQFDAGQLDWVPLTRDELAGNAHPARGTLVTGESNGVDYLTAITDRAPFNNADARLAVSYALDRTKLSQTLYGGLQAPARSIVPPTIPGYPQDGACPSCTGDAAQAKAHAQKAGLAAGTKITLNIINRPLDTKMAQVIQGQLAAALGWQVTIQPRSVTDYYTKTLMDKNVTGGLYLTPWSAGDVPAAADFLYQQLGSQFAKVGSTGQLLGSNFSRFSDSRFDALIAKAESTPDDKARDALVHQAEDLALQEMPIIPLIYFTPVRLADTGRFIPPRLDPDGDLVLSGEALR